MQKCTSDQVTYLLKIHHWLSIVLRRQPKLLSVTMKGPAGSSPSSFSNILLTNLVVIFQVLPALNHSLFYLSRRLMISHEVAVKILARAATI